MTSNEQLNDMRPLDDAELDHVFGGLNAGQVFVVAMATVVGAELTGGFGGAYAGAAAAAYLLS